MTIQVYGFQLTERPGCLHYRSVRDNIAIKFRCCRDYYACYLCHQASVDHPTERWKSSEFHTKAVLCRRCGTELTIHQYLTCAHRCPECGVSFNPGCQEHLDLYFDRILATRFNEYLG